MIRFGYCSACQKMIPLVDLQAHATQAHPGEVVHLNLYLATPQGPAPAAVAAQELTGGESAGAGSDGDGRRQ